MQFSTNVISFSVLLLATILVKGVQGQYFCNGAIEFNPCPDTCVNPTAVTGVTASASDLTIDGFAGASVTCDSGYYDADGDLGTTTVCSSDNTPWTYTGSCTGKAHTATNCHTIRLTAGTSATEDDSVCTACDVGKFAATNNEVCAAWTDAAATDCEDGSFWTAGSTTADSTCVACTAGEFSASDNDACATWSEPTAADCADGSVWTAGSTTADSTCVECTGGTFSAGNNTACAAWSEPAATGCEDGFVWTTGSTTADSTCVELVWKTIRGCCRERVENSKRGLNHHGTASTETFFGSLDSVLISCTAACATDAVCTAVEVTKKNRAAAKCEFHVERMNAGDRSTKSCKKATCMVKTGFVAPETAAPSPASPTEWNERRGCCREHAGKKKYVNHVGTNIIIAERTYAAATKACKDECDGRSTCTAVETRRNQRKKVYMCELHTESGINASSRASKSCKKALCAVKV